METSLPTPMTARVYVNLPEGIMGEYGTKTLQIEVLMGKSSMMDCPLPCYDYSWGSLNNLVSDLTSRQSLE